LVRNGKYFVPPEKTDEDFKALFRRLALAGAGRPADKNGVPLGLWTPDSLTDAIAEVGDAGASVETRTVQLWFQDNDKGISSENIQRLARVFGCDDPGATREWMSELAVSQERLRARRKRERQLAGDTADRTASARSAEPTPQRLNLARRSEALFARRGSLLNLPVSVFAGAAALNFAAYLIGLDWITYTRDDGVTKQVGFLSAPNWTLLFLIFLPLFFTFAVELLKFWKTNERSIVRAYIGRPQVRRAWRSKVERSSTTYWAVFLICFLFAGLLQWTSLRLFPLMQGVNNDDIDWGSVAIVQPDAITTMEAIAFTGAAYAYMSVSFYLMGGGLILLWTLIHDFWGMTDGANGAGRSGPSDEVDAVGLRIMRGIFRCSATGLLVAICMKIQSRFSPTDSETVRAWLLSDARLFPSRQVPDGYGFATHWTSLLVVFPSCFVFLYAFVRIGCRRSLLMPSARMMVAFAFISMAYLLIAAFPGFSILLGIALLVAIYGLFDPSFGGGERKALEGSRGVS
jgi:hypothetical protein